MLANDVVQPKGIMVLAKASFIGAGRAVIGLPFEHPFDAIKTNMQALSKQSAATISQIYKNKGIAGFYSGFLVNAVRVLSKQLYRWPLMIGLTTFYQNKLGISELKSSTVTGLTMAIIQCGIICPLQRVKTWLMTSKKKTSLRNFFFTNEVKTLFKGFSPVFIKQTVSWVTFLSSASYFKEQFKIFYGTDRLTEYQIFLVSICVSLINTGFVMPIDYLKTQFQKHQGTEKLSLRELACQRYLNAGFKGFYIGWQVKLVQYTINSLFTVGIFESLLNDYKRSE